MYNFHLFHFDIYVAIFVLYNFHLFHFDIYVAIFFVL